MDDVRMTLPPNLEKAVEYRINGERLPRLLLLWVVGIATLALFALTVVLYAAINSGWYWHPRYYPRRYATPLSAFAFAGAVFLVLPSAGGRSSSPRTPTIAASRRAAIRCTRSSSSPSMTIPTAART